MLIIDELYMVSSDLWTDIYSRLGEIFMIISEIEFEGLSLTAVADLLKLPSVTRKLTFCQFSDKDSMEHLLGL